MLAMLVLATLAGRWEGTVKVPGLDLPVVIDFASDSAGRWTGSATFPGRGIKGAPLASIAVHDSDVAFALPGALGDPKFEAHLQPGGTLTGDFLQGGHTAPFTLRLAGPPQVEPLRKSGPVRAELEGEWTGDFQLNNRTIHATLTLAGTTAKFKIVGRREFDIPVDFVTEEAGFLNVDSPQTNMAYEGRYDSATRELRGVFRQGPSEIPLILHKK